MTYVESVISQFINTLEQLGDWVLDYLKETSKKEILFKRNRSLIFEVYIDLNYAWSTLERRSISRYYTFHGEKYVHIEE